jgi:hypothetical protein
MAEDQRIVLETVSSKHQRASDSVVSDSSVEVCVHVSHSAERYSPFY